MYNILPHILYLLFNSFIKVNITLVYDKKPYIDFRYEGEQTDLFDTT